MDLIRIGEQSTEAPIRRSPLCSLGTGNDEKKTTIRSQNLLPTDLVQSDDSIRNTRTGAVGLKPESDPGAGQTSINRCCVPACTRRLFGGFVFYQVFLFSKGRSQPSTLWMIRGLAELGASLLQLTQPTRSISVSSKSNLGRTRSDHDEKMNLKSLFLEATSERERWKKVFCALQLLQQEYLRAS